MNEIIKSYNDRLSTIVVKTTLPLAIRRCFQYLRELYPRLDAERLYQKIRFKGNPSLAFQKREIASAVMKQEEDGVYIEIALNFLSIFGSSSPLPSHYCELVLRSVDEGDVLRDFLDIFNHHAQRLIFPAWLKRRYYVQYQGDLKDRFSKYMLSMLGLYGEYHNRTTHLNMQRLLPYIGVLSMRACSAGTMLSILRHYLSRDEVEIEQCAPHMAGIPNWQYALLGEKNCSLNADCLLGDYVRSRSGKFRIILRSVEWETLVEYSYHGNKMNELEDLVEFILKEPLDYEALLHVKKERVMPLELASKTSAYLGVNSVIGLAQDDLEVPFIRRGRK
ncbi:MAG: type VI secretion system baseplate subunit TssG [Helicobacteraceae bacterium]|nr:type VI secretion system baseplate subunit TssG [Helicobacteraceae bacterium]